MDELENEKRKNTRREFERTVISNEHVKLQLNDLMLGALVLIAAVLSFTEFSLHAGDWKNLTALTIFLYIITLFIYRNCYSKGMLKGKRDPEYLDALKAYRTIRSEIASKNLVSHIPKFCTVYKKDEIRKYRESLLCDIDMDYDTYKEKYLMMSEREVSRQRLSLEAKRTIIKCNKAKTINLFPGMLLNESGEYDRYKLIGKSGRQRERQDKQIQAIARALYVLFGAVIAFDVIFNFSLLTVAQWVVRILPIIFSVISGSEGGFCNITVTETNFKRDQTNALGLFLEYANENNLIKPAYDVKETEQTEFEQKQNL